MIRFFEVVVVGLLIVAQNVAGQSVAPGKVCPEGKKRLQGRCSMR